MFKEEVNLIESLIQIKIIENLTKLNLAKLVGRSYQETEMSLQEAKRDIERIKERLIWFK